MKKKLWLVMLTVALAVGMITTEVMAESGFVKNTQIEKSKTATQLDENEETTVTLNVGGTESKTVSDVVFVLDKSTSVDVVDEAVAMLEELYEHQTTGEHKVKVGVVAFSHGATVIYDLNDFDSDALDEIKAGLAAEKQKSGSSTEAGLDAGKAMLDADSEVEASNKHLVLVSDGLTYTWGGYDGEIKTVYSEHFESKRGISDPIDTPKIHKGDDLEWAKSMLDMKTWMFENEAKIQKSLEKEAIYTTGPNPDNVISQSDFQSTACSFEVSAYKSAEHWQEMVANGYHLYSYADMKYKDSAPWGDHFMQGLGTIGGIAEQYTDTDGGEDGMFDRVQSSILYSIEKANVTDVIGNNFDLTSLDSFVMTVGGKEVTPKTIEANTVNFGEKNDDGIYPYTVTYDAKAQAGEQFVWAVNVPVEKTSPITLSYKLKLVNKEKNPGTYEVPTNESAVIEYENNDGGGSEEFEKPMVSYTVEKTVVQKTDKDSPDTGDDINMAAWIALAILSGIGALLAARKKLIK